MDNKTSQNSCFTIDLDFPKHFLTIVYLIVFFLGLLSNCFGLKSIVKNWRKLGSIKIFALNLCIADILYLLTLPFLVTYYIKSRIWTFGQPFCKITRILFNINLYGSIGFLTCISVYRYLGVVHTLTVKGRIKVRHTIGISLLVWILVLIQCLPDVYFDKTNQYKPQCFDTTGNNSTEKYLMYSITQTVTGFVIPLVIIVCCYGHMAVVLATNKDIGDTQLKLKCLRLVGVMAILFSICYIPFHIFRNLNLMTRVAKYYGHFCKPWYPSMYVAKHTSDGLACLNSALNPLVYLINTDDLLKKGFCFRKKQQEDPPSVYPILEQTNPTYAKSNGNIQEKTFLESPCPPAQL